jgi:hypothetical protein
MQTHAAACQQQRLCKQVAMQVQDQATHPLTSHWLPATAVLVVPQISGVILLES